MAERFAPRIVAFVNARDFAVPDWIIPLILAPFIGSFAGVLIQRLPAGQPVAVARSRCNGCSHILGPCELVPLVSFAMLGARCRWCRERISVTHLATELGCLAIAAGAVLVEANLQLVWLDCVLGWTLLTLAWIDWEHMLLPDVLTLPLILAGLGATLLYDPAAIAEHAAAAAIGYLAFRGIEVGYRHLRGRDGLGQGDAKLVAAGGAWLGLAALPAVVFIAAVFGLVTAAVLYAARRRFDSSSAMPFGPALCAAIASAWLGFDPIVMLMDKLQ
jgi:leader peptidase (prepilin peptidase)/N-methyltransferase